MAPAIELDEPAAGETAPPAQSQAEPPSQDLPDSVATATPDGPPEAQKVEQPAPQPTRKSEGLEAMAPTAKIAVEPAKPSMKKPPVRHAAKETAAAKPAKSAPVANLARPRPDRAGSAATASATAGSSLSVGDWNSLVSAQIRRNQHYPDSARGRGEEGVATIAFSVTRSGAIGAARLAASSGYRDLDAEALAAVRRSNPLPPPPGILGVPVARNVPIRFGLR